jgi:hypothetical protein
MYSFTLTHLGATANPHVDSRSIDIEHAWKLRMQEPQSLARISTCVRHVHMINVMSTRVSSTLPSFEYRW